MQRKLTKKEKFQRSAEVPKSAGKQVIKEISKDKILLRWLGLIVSLCAFILYANTLGHGYVLDDYSIILENKLTRQGWSALPTIFKTTYRFGYIFVSDDLYRPITKSLFAIQWALSPNNPSIGHWTNVIAFALTGWVLFNTLNLYSKGNIVFAFAAALLFMAHPIHTEVVANIKSLDEILGLLFCICSLRYVYDYAQKAEVKKLFLALLFYFCALMSKESSITFMGVFPLAVYFFTDAPKKIQLRTFLSLLFVAIIFILIRRSVTGLAAAEIHAGIDNLLVLAPDLAHRFATAVFIMGLYVKLFFFPHPLVFDYSAYQLSIIGLSDYRFIVSFTLFFALAVLAIWQFKKRNWISFGILFFFITASLSSNIFILIGTSMGERLMFTPSLGWCLAIGYLISKISAVQVSYQSIRNFFQENIKPVALSLLIVIAFGVKTISRNPVWKSNYTLYSNDVHLSPNSARTHYYLGNHINKEEFTKEMSTKQKDSIMQVSIAELKKSVSIYPSFTDAWNQLGVIYDRLNKPDSAVYFYETALKYNPTDPTVHNNIGTVFFKHGNYSEAIKAFSRACELNPNYAEAFANLGSCYGMQKDYNTAINNFNRAITIDPNYQQAYYFIGITYQSIGNAQQAQFYLNKAEELKAQ